MTTKPNIVIVGGGAGGLELAVRLGHSLGKKQRAIITLVDASSTHLWKPLLHEVAAGTLDSNEDELNYLTHAHAHHYRFQLGRMIGLDRHKRTITLAPVLNGRGVEVIPERSLPYDILVIAVGSVTNDFSTPGVNECCLFLDSRDQADRFQQRFLMSMLHAQYQKTPLAKGQLDIAIVGGGATGVELAAELDYSIEHAVAYGLDNIIPRRDVKITIIEAADRILSALPVRVSVATERLLRERNIAVLTNERITEVTEAGLRTASGKFIPALLKIWAAGIKAPAFLKNLDGLETNAINQLLVKLTLQTTVDENIFALGDCSSCPRPHYQRPVPPRAQAAHQQAKLLAKSLVRKLEGKSLLNYTFHDYGSLVSLSRYDAVGNLMGRITSVMIEGKIARMAYLSLYKKHQVALHGVWRVMLSTLANLLTRRLKPRLKLH